MLDLRHSNVGVDNKSKRLPPEGCIDLGVVASVTRDMRSSRSGD